LEVNVYDGHFVGGRVRIRIPLKAWLKLVILGKTYLAHNTKPGWNGELPFYIAKCRQHGYFLDYPHGWSGYLHCPLCNSFKKDGLKQL